MAARWSPCPAIRCLISRPFRKPTKARKRPPVAHSTTTAPQVLQAKCHDDGTDKFLCEVTFISKAMRSAPISTSSALLGAGAGWEINSGLCQALRVQALRGQSGDRVRFEPFLRQQQVRSVLINADIPTR